MLQTSTTDTEINLLPNGQISKTVVSALSPDDNAFYNSIKDELNKIARDPSQESIDTVLNYSKLLNS